MINRLFNSPLFWLQTAFLVSLSATVGSFVLSQVLNLFPCELCWWQRVFMFNLPFIFGAALIMKRTDVFWYAFPLVVIGAAIAAYHYALQFVPQVANVCGASVISCSERQVELLGFITIPFGSFMAFAAIGIALLMLRRAEHSAARV